MVAYILHMIYMHIKYICIAVEIEIKLRYLQIKCVRKNIQKAAKLVVKFPQRNNRLKTSQAVIIKICLCL